MEIDLNEEDNSETSEFVNFSIRAYVAEIRKKDWKRCWPFGSLGDPNKDGASAPNYMIASQEIDDNMGETVCDESSESTSSQVNNAQCRNDNSVVIEGAKTGNGTVAADHDGPGRNWTRRKAQRFLLLSDLLRQLAGPSGGFDVHCDMTNADIVNSRFATETEDESDDVTLDTFFRKRKGVKVTPVGGSELKKKKKRRRRKTIRVEELRLDLDKRSNPGSKDSHFIQVTNTKATVTAHEDSEMEAVMLLARHFNEAANPSRTGRGAKRGQTVQSTPRTNVEVEPSGAKKRSTTTTALSKYGKGTSGASFIQAKSHSGGNQSAEHGHGQRFANVDISSDDTELVCACVQKKIRENSTAAGNKSKPASKDPVFYSDPHKKFTKGKLAEARRSSSMPPKVTNARLDTLEPSSLVSTVCQRQVELYIMKAAGVAWDEQRGAPTVCSVNRNPADFTVPNAENKFMWGG